MSHLNWGRCICTQDVAQDYSSCQPAWLVIIQKWVEGSCLFSSPCEFRTLWMRVHPNRETLPLGTYGLGFFGLPNPRFLPPLPSAGGKTTPFSLSDSSQSSCRPFKIKFLNSTGYFGNSEIVGCVALFVSITCSPVKADILELASSVLAFCRWNMNAFILRKNKRKRTTKTLALLG